MRVWMSLLLLLASVSPAWAGATLRLTADRPVVIVVNLVPYTVGDMAPVDVPIKNGREGAQKITVRNLMGQQVWSDTIVVRENTQVTLAWKDRELQVVDRALLKNAAALGGGRSGPPRQEAGHKTLEALASDGGRTSQGNLLDLATETEAPPPPPQPSPDATAAAPLPTGTSGTTAVARADALRHSFVPPGSPGAATLQLIPKTQSWANLWVDGEKIWEYRADAPAMIVDLSSGSHEIVVRDFRDKDVWGMGTITVSSGGAAELHFAKSQDLQVRDAEWSPADGG